MKPKRVDHIGIAVRSIAESLPLWEEALGLDFQAPEEVADQGVTVAVGRAGETRIELLEPAGPESPVARFLESRGPGIHHVALAVDDLTGALEKLSKRGIPLIDRAPRRGSEGRLIAFVHPRGGSGVLLELCQDP